MKFEKDNQVCITRDYKVIVGDTIDGLYRPSIVIMKGTLGRICSVSEVRNLYEVVFPSPSEGLQCSHVGLWIHEDDLCDFPTKRQKV